MIHFIFAGLRFALVHYGYWAVVGALLLENTGVPVPGETVLLLASFLAYSEQDLQLGWIIFAGTVACTLGDNLGYAIGSYGGRPLLERYRCTFRINDASIEKGERFFARYGAVTILFSRFVFGLRVIAGPLAGVLRMPWKRFTVFNLVGAACWVTVISGTGYIFGSRWEAMESFMKRFDVTLSAVLIALMLGGWWRLRGAREKS
jgi:membrane-associated protein